jgi:Immunity protein 30
MDETKSNSYGVGILTSILKANRLMRSKDEVLAFDNALVELAKNPQSEDLQELHLVLDDNCASCEVMWGLIHFLESFDEKEQFQAFVNVIPQLIVSAPEWTKIIHSRIYNDEPSRIVYEDILKSADSHTQKIVSKILKEVVQERQTINA